MKYIIKTNATMKEYDNKKWWIDKNIITEKTIVAGSVADALKNYQKEVADRHYIFISDNALKNKEPMYIDTKNGVKQVGYVMTAKTDFSDDYGNWKSKYIDLWVEIITVIDTEFE